MDQHIKLSPHFTLGEMTTSKHKEIKNEPTGGALDNLINLCQWLEKLRQSYNEWFDAVCELPNGKLHDKPIVINSGYRCPMLNRVVGGQETSNHLTGCACDIRANDGRDAILKAELLIEIFEASDESWDEIIVERKGAKTWWVHFAVRPKNGKLPNRKKVTIMSG